MEKNFHNKNPKREERAMQTPRPQVKAVKMPSPKGLAAVIRADISNFRNVAGKESTSLKASEFFSEFREHVNIACASHGAVLGNQVGDRQIIHLVGGTSKVGKLLEKIVKIANEIFVAFKKLTAKFRLGEAINEIRLAVDYCRCELLEPSHPEFGSLVYGAGDQNEVVSIHGGSSWLCELGSSDSLRTWISDKVNRIERNTRIGATQPSREALLWKNQLHRFALHIGNKCTRGILTVGIRDPKDKGVFKGLLAQHGPDSTNDQNIMIPKMLMGQLAHNDQRTDFALVSISTFE